MFTKYQDVFIELQRRLERNQAVGNCLSFNLRKKYRLIAVDMLISQVVFETLSILEDKKIIK